MKDGTMKILYLGTDGKVQLMKVRDDIEVYQQLVEGYIECLYTGDYIVVCNDEGRIRNLPENENARRFLKYLTTIHGNCFIVGKGEDDFRSLDDIDMITLSGIFDTIEII